MWNSTRGSPCSPAKRARASRSCSTRSACCSATVSSNASCGPVAERAELSAIFDVDTARGVAQWLAAEAFDAGDELLLRRVQDAQGRSRAWINGRAATLRNSPRWASNCSTCTASTRTRRSRALPRNATCSTNSAIPRRSRARCPRRGARGATRSRDATPPRRPRRRLRPSATCSPSATASSPHSA